MTPRLHALCRWTTILPTTFLPTGLVDNHRPFRIPHATPAVLTTTPKHTPPPLRYLPRTLPSPPTPNSLHYTSPGARGRCSEQNNRRAITHCVELVAVAPHCLLRAGDLFIHTPGMPQPPPTPGDLWRLRNNTGRRNDISTLVRKTDRTTLLL